MAGFGHKYGNVLGTGSHIPPNFTGIPTQVQRILGEFGPFLAQNIWEQPCT